MTSLNFGRSFPGVMTRIELGRVYAILVKVFVKTSLRVTMDLRHTRIFDLLLVTKSKMYYEVELKLKVKSTSKIKDHVKKCCEQFSGPCCNYAGRVERIVVFRNNDIAGRAKSYYRNVSTCRFIIIALSEDDVYRHIR
jgi:ribosomal protein S10